MWQDYAIAVVQVLFAVALIPTIMDKKHKPALSTCVWNAIGTGVLVSAYTSLGLWSSSIVAAVVGAQWVVLGVQRHRLNKESSGEPNVPFGKLVDQILMRD